VGSVLSFLLLSKPMDGTMANFIVTFKFKADDTRSDRYNSFVKKINELTSYEHWDETTSFYCFEIAMSAETLCSALYIDSDFNATKDMMVVIDVTNKQKATKGELQWPSLLDSYLGF
jgi:cellobiose phosphorylase